MTQNINQSQTEDEPGERSEEVWRAIRYLDPDGVRDWHYVTFIFGCIALITLAIVVAAWAT